MGPNRPFKAEICPFKRPDPRKTPFPTSINIAGPIPTDFARSGRFLGSKYAHGPFWGKYPPQFHARTQLQILIGPSFQKSTKTPLKQQIFQGRKFRSANGCKRFFFFKNSIFVFFSWQVSLPTALYDVHSRGAWRAPQQCSFKTSVNSKNHSVCELPKFFRQCFLEKWLNINKCG